MTVSIPYERSNRPTDDTWLGAGGALLALGCLSATGGRIGVLAGAFVLACWYVAPSIYAVALGHVAYAAVAPTLQLTPWTVGLEIGLFCVLVAPGMDRGGFRAIVLASGTSIVVLGGAGWAVWALTDRLWIASATVCGLGAALLYAVHRYEWVRVHRSSVIA